MRQLETLSLQQNQLVDLASLAKDLAAKFPKLSTLNLDGNPCTPSEFASSGLYSSWHAELLLP